MKSLLLVRHAKSDWGNTSLSDFDRPLNERGKKDAPEMAARLLAKKIKINAFVASPAKRAAKTAKIFAAAFNVKKEDILSREELYLASPAMFYSVIETMDDDDDCIAVFSHNDGITEFANMLTDARIDNIPTCGIFAIRIKSKSWKDFRQAKKEFWFVDYPKAGENTD
jgi:phosphohistidine phosphatase